MSTSFLAAVTERAASGAAPLAFAGSGGHNGLIEDVLYQNITIDEPHDSAIWIGPAQQADNSNPCHPNPCSLCWPTLPTAECNLPAGGLFRNITLRDITVNNPMKPHSFVMANTTNPMQSVHFDNVVVNNPGTKKGKNYWAVCKGVTGGVATGRTSPVPSCFTDHTDPAREMGANK